MNKTCKYQELLFLIKLIFCNNNKKKSHWLFVEGTMVMITIRLTYKNKKVIPTAQVYVVMPRHKVSES